jgi:transposase InsO family protein
MTITMKDARTPTLTEMRALVKASTHLSFTATNKQETYVWIERLLTQTNYRKLRKKHRIIVRRYIRTMTGYSKAQTDRLISAWRKTGRIRAKQYRRNSFPRTYTEADVILLARVDEAHNNLSGPATAKILQDEWQVFGRREFATLSGLCASHVYNLRKHRRYRETNRTFQKTKPTAVAIGERRKPQPDGAAGFLRVDSVHTGDAKEGEHGAYFINLVDEVTQWEVVMCVEAISERYLKVALAGALALLPFVVTNFHADNGSEYINHTVAALLNKIHCGLTKSRPRRCNDNALVESKNGHVIRKHFGHSHIPGSAASLVQAYCLKWFNLYLTLHRPCGFAEEVVVNKYGKIKKHYPHGGYMTPYEKWKSLPEDKQNRKRGITFEQLDKQAYRESHTQFAEAMNTAKQVLFKQIYS